MFLLLVYFTVNDKKIIPNLILSDLLYSGFNPCPTEVYQKTLIEFNERWLKDSIMFMRPNDILWKFSVSSFGH